MKVKYIPSEVDIKAIALMNDADNICCLLTGSTIDEILSKVDIEIESRLKRVDSIENEFDRNFYRQGIRILVEIKEFLNKGD